MWDRGSEVSVGGRKPRALLAVLLLHPNEVVSADRLIEELWAGESPEHGGDALRVNVSRLRKALPQDVLTTRSPGYVLRVEPEALDLHRFERLVDEGRSLLARGLAAEASDQLHQALSLWRGPALADFAYESFAQIAVARMEEIKVAALELRIEADLALARHDELVGELEALVTEHPLRERLRRYLMTALRSICGPRLPTSGSALSEDSAFAVSRSPFETRARPVLVSSSPSEAATTVSLKSPS